jgi:hypothetical protein
VGALADRLEQSRPHCFLWLIDVIAAERFRAATIFSCRHADGGRAAARRPAV